MAQAMPAHLGGSYRTGAFGDGIGGVAVGGAGAGAGARAGAVEEGCIGGACCASPAGDPVISYVGTGSGNYIQETTYKYVGHGAGEFEVVAPRRAGGCNWLLICGSVGILLLAALVVFFSLPSPTTTTTPGLLAATALPYDCSAGLVNWKVGWSISKQAWCCDHSGVGCQPTAMSKICKLWGDPHIITFDNANPSFYGDGDFWIVKSSTVQIQGRFEGTKYTEGLAATNRIVVSGPFIQNHKIEIGTRQSGVLHVDLQPVIKSFPSSYTSMDGSYKLTYDNQGEVPDVVPEGNEKRVFHMDLPLGVRVTVFQWSNYLDATIEMPAQPGQDGACGNFNGDASDDSTEKIMSRVGADVEGGASYLSGRAAIEFTPQMEKMMAAECPVARKAQARDECARNLGGQTAGLAIKTCMFNVCFGDNPRARQQARTFA